MSNKYVKWPPVEGVSETYNESEEENFTTNNQQVIEEVVKAISAMTISTLVVPEISYETFPDEISVGYDLIYYPEIVGSNLFFTIQNSPLGMVIDSENGCIEYKAIKAGEHKGIIINFKNDYHSGSLVLDLVVDNLWYRESNLIEFYDSKRYTNGSRGWPSSNRKVSGGFINNSVAQKPSLIKRFVGNNTNVLYFDGVDDVLKNKTNSYLQSIKSGVIFFKPEMDNNTYAQLIGNYELGVHLAIDNRNGNKNGFSFDGSSNSSFKNKGLVVDLSDGFSKGSYKENSNDVVWKNNEWNKMYFEFDNSVTFTDEMHLGALEINGGDYYFFKGYIMFVSFFKEDLKEEEINDILTWANNKH